MSIRKHRRAVTAGCILVALTSVSLGNKLPGELISGHLTAVAGNSSVQIDGKVYRIKSGSPAAHAVATLTPGQVIDAQLNGPANSAATEVVNLVARSSK